MLGDAVCGFKITAVQQLYLHLASLPLVFATITLATVVTSKVVHTDESQWRRMRCALLILMRVLPEALYTYLIHVTERMRSTSLLLRS